MKPPLLRWKPETPAQKRALEALQEVLKLPHRNREEARKRTALLREHVRRLRKLGCKVEISGTGPMSGKSADAIIVDDPIEETP